MAMSLPEEIRPETHSQSADSLNAPSSQKLRVGGFPEEIFEDLSENEKDSLFCNICLNLVNQCQKCSNSHIFCKSCIFVWTQVSSSNSTKCPVCRTPQADYVSVPEADQQLVNKEVSCPVENCSFKSSLRLFLLHAHGKSMYCNEQNDYDRFKAESRRSNDEHLADENERFVELITFIERFNIVQSLLSFETLLGNNRSLTLLNVLHEIVGMPNRRDSVESSPSQILLGFSVPTALANSLERSAHPPIDDDNPRNERDFSRGSIPNSPSSAGLDDGSSFDVVLDNISLSTQSSSLFGSLSGSSRTSDSSSLSSSSADDGSFDFQAFYRAVSSHLESDSSEEDEDYLVTQTNGLTEEFLTQSASTDTLVDNCAINENMNANAIDNFGNRKSTLGNGIDIFRDSALPIEPFSHVSNDLSFLERSIEPFTLDSNDLSFLERSPDDSDKETSPIYCDQSDPQEKLYGYGIKPNSNGAKLLPSRVSGLPLVTSRKVSRSATNRDIVSPMTSLSSQRANTFTNPLISNFKRSSELKKPFETSNKVSLMTERPGRLLKLENSKTNLVTAAELNVRKQHENLALSRSQPSKSGLKLTKEILHSPNVARISRQASSHKLGETSKKPSNYRAEAFKLPSIYAPSTNSKSVKTICSSKLPKVATETMDPPRIKKSFSKTSPPSVGKNKY